jgi:ribosomal protein L9
MDNPIRHEGEYSVVVKLDEGINATVKVAVIKEQ